MSKIDLAASPINLPLTYPVWVELIILGKTEIILAVITLDTIFASTLINVS